MKTTTTYRAEINIPVPPEMFVALKQIPPQTIEEAELQQVKLELIIAGDSTESLSAAKKYIHDFVNDVMEAERAGEEIVL